MRNKNIKIIAVVLFVVVVIGIFLPGEPVPEVTYIRTCEDVIQTVSEEGHYYLVNIADEELATTTQINNRTSKNLDVNSDESVYIGYLKAEDKLRMNCIPVNWFDSELTWEDSTMRIEVYQGKK